MELDEFIKSTLVSIVKGVREANEATKPFRQEDIRDSPLFAVHRATKGDESGKVIFDVALTVSEASTGKGGGGIKVAGVGFGAEAGKSLTAGHESRIKFQVEVSQIVY
jgi:hypothetical protein